MDLSIYFKAVLEGEQSAVVLCDLNHKIIYMNPFAINRYHRDLTGQNLMDCHNADSREKIEKTLEWFREDKSHNQVFEFHNDKENKDAYLVAIRDDNGELIGYWEQHKYRTPDTDSFYNYK